MEADDEPKIEESGEEYDKEQNCDCCDAPLPGILFEEFDEKHFIIMRCDSCSLFEDDISAAIFLSRKLARSWKRWLDQYPENYFRPIMELTEKEIVMLTTREVWTTMFNGVDFSFG